MRAGRRRARIIGGLTRANRQRIVAGAVVGTTRDSLDWEMATMQYNANQRRGGPVVSCLDP
jgi:hypothetical protein